MADIDKIRIKQLDDSADYDLWRIRVEAACSAKGFGAVLEEPSAPLSSSSDETQKFADRQRQASNLVISALGDHALRVVRTVIGKPYEMLEKLDKRYNSHSTATKITKMTELVSMKYCNPKADITKHIDRMASILETLRSMKSGLDEALSIGILVASIEVSELLPVVAAIKTLSERDVKWETVSARLIEESKAVKREFKEEAKAASAGCPICQKMHPIERCWLNPKNPRNRLSLGRKSDRDETSEIEERTTGTVDAKAEHGKGLKDTRNKNKTRSAMARTTHSRIEMANTKPTHTQNRLMIDSGTTSHMTPKSETVDDRSDCNIPIWLADDSKAFATCKGTRRVTWCSENGPVNVSLSDTLVSEDIAPNLLSVPALVRKGIFVLFMEGKAILFDSKDGFSVLAYALQDEDGLFYISDQQNSPQANRAVPANDHIQSCMAVARHYMEHDATSSSADTQSSHDPDPEDSEAEEISTSIDSDFIDHDHGDLPAPTVNPSPAEIWHLRLGHLLTLDATKRHLRDGILPKPVTATTGCNVCVKSKFRKRYAGSLTNANTLGHLHADIKGKIEVPSTTGQNYFLTIVDGFSRFTYVEPTTTKGEASQAVLRFVKRFERQTGHTVRSLHTDGGKEFHLAREKLREECVYTTKTTAYTLQSNGLAERSHGIILTIARAALLQANLPFSYWDYAVQHVAKGKNFVIHSTTRDVPYDAAHGHPSSHLKYHKPFGCRMLYHPVVSKLPTFAPRLQEGICLGHSGGGLYTVLTTNGMATTKHVQAFENEFPGLSIISSVPAPPDSGDAEESGFFEIPLPPPHLADDNDPQPLPNDPDSSAESASDGYTTPDYGGDDMDNMLTHIPPVPSSFGDSQHDNLEEYSRPPRLRQIGRVNYTYKALPVRDGCLPPSGKVGTSA